MAGCLPAHTTALQPVTLAVLWWQQVPAGYIWQLPPALLLLGRCLHCMRITALMPACMAYVVENRRGVWCEHACVPACALACSSRRSCSAWRLQCWRVTCMAARWVWLVFLIKALSLGCKGQKCWQNGGHWCCLLQLAGWMSSAAWCAGLVAGADAKHVQGLKWVLSCVASVVAAAVHPARTRGACALDSCCTPQLHAFFTLR